MGNVVEVKFGNGRIVYNAAEEAIPPDTKTTGAATTTNAGIPGKPANFEVNFTLKITSELDGIRFNNVFGWTEFVAEMPEDAPYRQVEDKAARNLAPALRAVADLIDKEIERFDASNRPDE